LVVANFITMPNWRTGSTLLEIAAKIIEANYSTLRATRLRRTLAQSYRGGEYFCGYSVVQLVLCSL
jgi:hypothetical protein